MALRVRATKTSIGVGTGDDPQIIVNAEVYEDTNNQIVASQVFQFSLAGIANLTDAQKRAVIVNAADAWAAEVKANAAAATPILTLMGQSKVIP